VHRLHDHDDDHRDDDDDRYDDDDWHDYWFHYVDVHYDGHHADGPERQHDHPDDDAAATDDDHVDAGAERPTTTHSDPPSEAEAEDAGGASWIEDAAEDATAVSGGRAGEQSAGTVRGAGKRLDGDWPVPDEAQQLWPEPMDIHKRGAYWEG
jgi:hypothetical protein